MGAGREVLGEGLACGGEQDVAGLGQAAGDDDDLGVQQRAHIGQPHPQPVGELLVALQGGGVPLAGRGGDGLAGDVLRIAAGELDDAGRVVGAELRQLPGVDAQGRAGAVALQAPAQAAPAGAPAGNDVEVPDLPAESGRPAQEVAVDDDGPAHAGADGHDEGVALAAGRPETGLGPPEGIGVVLDDDGQAHALGDDVADPHPGPVQVGAVRHRVAVGGHEARRPDAHGGHVGEVLPQPAHHRRDRVNDRLAVGGGGVAPNRLKNLPLVVDDAGRDLRSADIHSDAQCHARAPW